MRKLLKGGSSMMSKSYNSLFVSLSVLVNMMIVYIVFSVGFGGFSWPAHHGDIPHVVSYYIINVGLGLLMGQLFDVR